MRNKPTVGQTLYALNIGNNARHVEQVLRPVTVISVGRKYFKARPEGFADHCANEYHLDSGYENSTHTAGWRCYESPQEWEDEREAAAISEVFRKTFSCGNNNFAVDRLRAAHRALYGIQTEPKPARSETKGGTDEA